LQVFASGNSTDLLKTRLSRRSQQFSLFDHRTLDHPQSPSGSSSPPAYSPLPWYFWFTRCQLTYGSFTPQTPLPDDCQLFSAITFHWDVQKLTDVAATVSGLPGASFCVFARFSRVDAFCPLCEDAAASSALYVSSRLPPYQPRLLLSYTAKNSCLASFRSKNPESVSVCACYKPLSSRFKEGKHRQPLRPCPL